VLGTNPPESNLKLSVNVPDFKSMNKHAKNTNKKDRIKRMPLCSESSSSSDNEEEIAENK
jgi:hypothetical protein